VETLPLRSFFAAGESSPCPEWSCKTDIYGSPIIELHTQRLPRRICGPTEPLLWQL